MLILEGAPGSSRAAWRWTALRPCSTRCCRVSHWQHSCARQLPSPVPAGVRRPRRAKLGAATST